MSPCTWIISERSDRWRRAVDGFAPALLPGGLLRPSASPAEVPEAVRGGAVIVLYELPIESPRETLQALTLCAALDHPPLQLVAFAPELRIESRAELELTAALRQLGAEAVLRHPEHLRLLGRLVARYVHGGHRLASRRL